LEHRFRERSRTASTQAFSALRDTLSKIGDPFAGRSELSEDAAITILDTSKVM
jgi:hypothetical protein